MMKTDNWSNARSRDYLIQTQGSSLADQTKSPGRDGILGAALSSLRYSEGRSFILIASFVRWGRALGGRDNSMDSSL